jgi:hypothetical protein
MVFANDFCADFNPWRDPDRSLDRDFGILDIVVYYRVVLFTGSCFAAATNVAFVAAGFVGFFGLFVGFVVFGVFAGASV